MKNLTISKLALAGLVLFIFGFVTGILVHKKFMPCAVLPVVTIQRDTITKRDTVQGVVQPPVRTKVTRYDTAELKIVPGDSGGFVVDTMRKPTAYRYERDTLPVNRQTPALGLAKPADQPILVNRVTSAQVVVPITQSTFTGLDYKAVVSGYHVSLDSIFTFPKTITYRETITTQLPPKRINWALTAGPSVTYCTDKQVRFGAGITLGFVIGGKH